MWNISGLLSLLQAFLLSSAESKNATSELPDYGSTRILGGVPALPGRYPYMVGLYDEGFFGYQKYPYCGGTLIAPTWVLSAAHCSDRRGELHTAIIGKHDFDDDATEPYEAINVIREIVHPKYNVDDFDFMLLELEQASTFTPVKLDTGDECFSINDRLVTMGWGAVAPGLPFKTDVLREVELGYVPQYLCQVPHLFTLGGIVTKRMMCAWRLLGDSCGGDSGGPLIVKARDSNYTNDIQVGVSSWGAACGVPTHPGVYARVSKAMSFIKEYVNITYA